MELTHGRSIAASWIAPFEPFKICEEESWGSMMFHRESEPPYDVEDDFAYEFKDMYHRPRGSIWQRMQIWAENDWRQRYAIYSATFNSLVSSIRLAVWGFSNWRESESSYDVEDDLAYEFKVPKTLHKAALIWCKKISAAGYKMTMEISSKGGFDIAIGSYTVHVPKYSSVHHPLIQMVLFARALYNSTLRRPKFIVPKSMVKINKSGLAIMMPQSHSPNTVSEPKDVHALADIAPENHSMIPGLDKNIPELGELDYNVDMSTVPVHSRGFALEDVYNLHNLTSAPSFADHGITKAENKTEDSGFVNITKAEDGTEDRRLANIAKAEDDTEDGRLEKVTWLMATAAVHHATGIRDLLSGFTTIKDLFVKAGHGVSMPVCGRGSVITGKVVLQDVWFVPGLTENLVSVTQLTDLDYSVGFARAACTIKSATDGLVIGKAHVSDDGLFEVDFLKVGPVI